MTVQVELLKSISCFAGLNQAELAAIRGLIFERAIERGEIIIFEGEPATELFFVVSGVVKVFKTSTEGKEQILSIVRPGESFNEVPVFDNGLNIASVQAMGPVVLYKVKKEDMKTIVRERPPVAINVIKVMAERVRQLVSLVEDLSFRNVVSRVAKILLEYAGDNAGSKSRLTQQEIASMAGTVREVVGRSLKSLEEEGVIRLDRHRIIITNKEALKRMVAFSF